MVFFCSGALFSISPHFLIFSLFSIYHLLFLSQSIICFFFLFLNLPFASSRFSFFSHSLSFCYFCSTLSFSSYLFALFCCLLRFPSLLLILFSDFLLFFLLFFPILHLLLILSDFLLFLFLIRYRSFILT